MVLEQDERRGGVVRDLFQHIPCLVLGEDVHTALFDHCLGTGFRALLEAGFALEAEADQRADLAAELDRLLLGQVAEMLRLQFTVRALVDRQRVDHPDGVARPQTLQFSDDLTVELGV